MGRQQEIGLLLERWAVVHDGEGQVVLLSGEPGMGKSRILRSEALQVDDVLALESPQRGFCLL